MFFKNARGDVNARNIVAKSISAPITGNVTGATTGLHTGAVVLPTYTVAQLAASPMTPAAGLAGMLVRCSNGNAGAACIAMCNGSAWVVVALGATCATS